MIVAGIDPSLTCTSIVLHADGIEHVTRIETLPKHYTSAPHRRAYLLERLNHTIDLDRCELVCIEGYSFGSLGQQHTIAEWGGAIRQWLWEAGVPYVEVPPTLVKRMATGKGNGEKSLVLREVFRKWGFSAEDDNDADAYVLFRCAEGLVCGTASDKLAALPVVMPKSSLGDWQPPSKTKRKSLGASGGIVRGSPARKSRGIDLTRNRQGSDDYAG